MEDDLMKPSKNHQDSPQSRVLCAPLIWCLNQLLRLLLEREWQAKKNPKHHISQVLTVTYERGRSRTRTTQLERSEEEEGEGGLPRFGGCEPIYFKSVIGGSNVLGFAPNLVSSFYT